VAIHHSQRDLDDRLRHDRPVVHTTPEVDGGAVDLVCGLDRRAEVGHR